MTVNGVGYYRHEMGHPVIKTMEVRLVIIYEEHWLNWYVETKYFPSCWNTVISPLFADQRFCKLQPVCQGHDAGGCGWSLQGLCEHLGVSDEHRREQANHFRRLNAGPQAAHRHQVLQTHAQAVQTWSALQREGEATSCKRYCDTLIATDKAALLVGFFPLIVCQPSPYRLRWLTLTGARLMGLGFVSKPSLLPRTTCTPASWSPRTARPPLRSHPSPRLPSTSGWRSVPVITEVLDGF